jgi:hypothetical protein
MLLREAALLTMDLEKVLTATTVVDKEALMADMADPA